MKISEIYKQKGFIASLEVFPPRNDLSIDTAIPVLDELNSLNPDFISVTCGAGGTIQSDNTALLCAHMKEHYQTEPVPHLTCITLTKKQVEERLKQLKEKGIENILAIRGDRPIENMQITPEYTYAKELIKDIGSKGFCVAGTCYPEAHIDCNSIEKEIEYTRQKAEAGASLLISQLSFSSDIFLSYFERLKSAGISIPVCAGVMPILSKEQVERMIYMCGVSLPGRIVRILAKYQDNKEDLEKAGIEYAFNQIQTLKSAGVDGVHIYTMNKPNIAKALFEAVR
ncbi:MAG: methylenetetrahydrofolate reductase [Clostridia bacterium]|nr:methylenetetrahydrofolate reductase [Clostridia bacterium]